MRKIDLLKSLLDSQVKDTFNWEIVKPVIEEAPYNHLNLILPQQEIGFAFDKTGEKFLGIVNWKG